MEMRFSYERDSAPAGTRFLFYFVGHYRTFNGERNEAFYFLCKLLGPVLIRGRVVLSSKTSKSRRSPDDKASVDRDRIQIE